VDAEGDASVSGLVAQTPLAIAALSEQPRIDKGGDPVNGRRAILLASSVPVGVFKALLASETRPKAS
jgi:hypothetical protein